jgi:hypothetical protein
MLTNLIVVDGFFDDPEAIRRRALAGTCSPPRTKRIAATFLSWFPRMVNGPPALDRRRGRRPPDVQIAKPSRQTARP